MNAPAGQRPRAAAGDVEGERFRAEHADLNVRRKLLVVALAIAPEPHAPFRTEHLAVAAHELFPEDFGLVFYGSPDVASVYSRLSGAEGMVGVGWCEWVSTRTLRLTDTGRREARGATRGQVPPLKTARMPVAALAVVAPERPATLQAPPTRRSASSTRPSRRTALSLASVDPPPSPDRPPPPPPAPVRRLPLPPRPPAPARRPPAPAPLPAAATAAPASAAPAAAELRPLTTQQVRTVRRLGMLSVVERMERGQPLDRGLALKCWDVVPWADDAAFRKGASETREAIEAVIAAHRARPGNVGVDVPDLVTCERLLLAQGTFENRLLNRPGAQG